MRSMGLMTSGNTGNFGGNLNEIHGQPFDKLQEYPIRGKWRIFFPGMGPACLYTGKLLCQMKSSNRGAPLVTVEGI